MRAIARAEAEARNLLDSGDPQGAIAALEAVRQAGGSSETETLLARARAAAEEAARREEARRRLAVALAQPERSEERAQALDRAIGLDPSLAPARLARARLALVRAEERSRALRRDALEGARRDLAGISEPEARLLEARRLELGGEDPRPVLEPIAASTGPAADEARARLALLGGDAKACRLLDAVVATRPDDVDARVLRARGRLLAGDRDGARADLDAALAFDPASFPARALALKDAMDHHDVERVARLLETAAGNGASAPAVLAARARLARARGETRAAEEDVASALERDPDCAAALAVRGGLAIDRNDFPRARQWLDRALSIDAGDVDALIERGKLRARDDQLPGALADLEAALARGGPRRDVLVEISDTRHRMGDIRLALDAIERAIAIPGAEPELLVRRARLRSALGDSEHALEDLDAVARQRPSDGQIQFLRGQLLDAANREEAAVEAYSRAIELAPGLSDSYARRGFLLFDLRRFSEARADLETYLARQPRGEMAERAKKTLERAGAQER
jgi:tetratricopeptide (TPR) repeat protein